MLVKEIKNNKIDNKNQTNIDNKRMVSQLLTLDKSKINNKQLKIKIAILNQLLQINNIKRKELIITINNKNNKSKDIRSLIVQHYDILFKLLFIKM